MGSGVGVTDFSELSLKIQKGSLSARDTLRQLNPECDGKLLSSCKQGIISFNLHFRKITLSAFRSAQCRSLFQPQVTLLS